MSQHLTAPSASLVAGRARLDERGAAALEYGVVVTLIFVALAFLAGATVVS